MNKFRTLLTFALLVLSIFFITSLFKPVSAGPKLHFVIIYPGGPSPSGQGSQIINQFIKTLAAKTAISTSSLQGAYFNDIAKADRYVQNNSNSFIMGSVGFFLSRKKKFNLEPLTTLKLPGGNFEQYYVLVKKGTYGVLKHLRGKILCGNVLYEDSRFINTIIFNNKINAQRFFKLQPTRNPLTALRKVTRGELDAVIINSMQFNSLKGISFFQNLQVVYRSGEMPALGLMMRNTPANKAVKTKIINAITGMCESGEGRSVCGNFGIKGFDAITPGQKQSLKALSKKYEK